MAVFLRFLSELAESAEFVEKSELQRTATNWGEVGSLSAKLPSPFRRDRKALNGKVVCGVLNPDCRRLPRRSAKVSFRASLGRA